MDDLSNYSPPRNIDPDLTPGPLRSGPSKEITSTLNEAADPGAPPKSKSNIVSLASSAAKMTLRGVKEAADAFPPLKSATAALCFILDNCEVLSTSRALDNVYLCFLEHDGVSPNDRIVDSPG